MVLGALESERFVLQRPVGAGGMGIVYEARERATGERVAIKTLHELDGHALYRLKNEFRQLQGIVHDNLVGLRELVKEGDAWLLVMDFVEGLDVVSHVRGGDRESLASTLDGKAAARRVLVDSSPPMERALDYQAVRRITGEIAAGLHALHEAGCVHRDIKPSNILVRRDGRPIILDFGLVAQQIGIDSTDGALVGTLPYMAPEQALGQRASPAVDCYALGVVLFEMLTGDWPHRGDMMEVIAAKQTVPAPDPSTLAPATPADLDHLCGELLRRDPLRRPSALDVSRRLAVGAPARARPVTRTGSMGGRFVGRRRELAQLAQVMQQTRTGALGMVWIRGESGVGKSALLRRFAEETRDRHHDVVVLQTRCLEHESLPFKAVDGIVDALSGFLRNLRSEDAALLLPRYASFLRVAFPVLTRVDAIARAPYPVRPVQDPHERRQRAFASLRELLGRVAERYPLVLVVDNLQWGDDDSVQLLQEVLRPPDPPPLMLIVASGDTARASELVARLEAFGDPVHRIALAALDRSEATELARHLLENAGVAGRISPEAIGAEAAGSPLMVQELVRHVASFARTPPAHPILNDAIRLRIASFSPPVQHVLQAVCLAGAPISMEALGVATALDMVELSRVVATLVAESLLRSSSSPTGLLEPYHDRVRHAVLEVLDDTTRRHGHERLASALEGTRLAASHPELLLHHYQACDQPVLAAKYAERAARQASDALAFGRAAELLELALSLDPGDAETERSLHVALAEALGRAGRLLDSADHYLAASQGADRQVSFRLKCRALEQLLRGGALERGRDLADEVLAPLHLRIARTARRAILDVVVQRLLLRLRGMSYVERPIDEIPASELETVDVLWSIGTALAFMDPVRSRPLSVRHSRRALRTGDARRISLAFGQESTYVSITSGNQRLADRYAERSMALATAVGTANAVGMAYGQRGLARYFRADFVAAAADLEQAIELLRSEAAEMRWEIDLAEIYRAASLMWLGRLRELDQLVSRLLTEAVQSGDQYLTTGLRSWRTNLLWLVKNRPAESRRHVVEAQQLTRRDFQGFGMHDTMYLNALCNADLYEGDAAGAWARIEAVWPALRRSHLLSMQSVHTDMAYLRARMAIAFAAVAPPSRCGGLLRAALRASSSLGGSTTRRALGALGKVMVASLSDAVDRVALTGALALADEAGLALHAASARLRFGERLGDAEMVAQARAYMTRERVVNSDALSRVIVPV